MLMEHYTDKWSPWVTPQPPVYPFPYTLPPPLPPTPSPLTQEEVDEFRKLLERAREYDRVNGEPECELEIKKNLLKELAKSLGVEIDFL